jgi:tetratricopeptide (TPR) repeat protein
MIVIIPLVLSLLAAGTPPQRRTAPQLARAGWEALNAGRAQEAAAAFEEALREAPREPTVLLGAGAAAHQLGQPDAARRYLGEALKNDPALTAASLLLGELLYRAGETSAAIDVYEKALVHAPEQRQLTERLEAWRKEAALHDRFGQKLGDHFTVLFEGPSEAELAQKAVEILEAAYWRIGSALYTYPYEVVVVVLSTREQFRDVTRSPAWAGAAYDGRIRVPVQGALQNMRDFERVLAHEFTHALVRSIARRDIPVWLNEGLAMMFDGTDVDAREAQLRAIESRPPLARLEKSLEQLDTAGATAAYAQSAVATRLLVRDAGLPAIVAILTDIGRGIPFAEAFERHANMPYAEFQKKVSAN